MRGQLTGSLPPGFTSPKRTSATALPPSVPGYQASRMAGTCSAAQRISSGRPFEKDEHDRLAGGDDGFKHLLLNAGQIEGGARGGFAAHAGDFAHDGDDEVGIGCGGFGLGDPVGGFCGRGRRKQSCCRRSVEQAGDRRVTVRDRRRS